MADRLDVAERLAEGRFAVDHTQRYVRACGALGYQHLDLTSHPSQIRDWYDAEDGLDLGALDSDCAQLRAAGAAAAEALGIQQAQLAGLAAAWTGPGADSAFRFLERHCDAASAVASELRAAAQRCESLRDNLWYLLDAKVTTAIAIDDRSAAQRSAWLAAAEMVTTGVGDRTDGRGHHPPTDNAVRGQRYSQRLARCDALDGGRGSDVLRHGDRPDGRNAGSAVRVSRRLRTRLGCVAARRATTVASVAAAPVAPVAAYSSLPADPAPAVGPIGPGAAAVAARRRRRRSWEPRRVTRRPCPPPPGIWAVLVVWPAGSSMRWAVCWGRSAGPLGDSSTLDDPLGTKNPFDGDAFHDGPR